MNKEIMLEKIRLRCLELEQMDESNEIRNIPRTEWKNKDIKNKILLWQVKPKTAKLIHKVAKECKPKLIVELGTSAGYSTLLFAKATNTYNTKIHTIECNPYRIKLAKESFEKTQTTANITLHEGKIKTILSNWEKTVDLIFFDADKEHYLEYFTMIEPFLSKNAVIIADNILDNPIKTNAFTTHLEQHPLFETNIYKIENGILIAKKYGGIKTKL